MGSFIRVVSILFTLSPAFTLIQLTGNLVFLTSMLLIYRSEESAIKPECAISFCQPGPATGPHYDAL